MGQDEVGGRWPEPMGKPIRLMGLIFYPAGNGKQFEGFQEWKRHSQICILNARSAHHSGYHVKMARGRAQEDCGEPGHNHPGRDDRGCARNAGEMCSGGRAGKRGGGFHVGTQREDV